MDEAVDVYLKASITPTRIASLSNFHFLLHNRIKVGIIQIILGYY